MKHAQKNSERKAVLSPGWQGLLCRGLNPVLDLTTSALQRRVPPQEARVMAGALQRRREREVLGLNLVCMEAAEDKE